MAWAFVGVSNVVEVTGTAHALVTTGIAGTLQAGDLLVACISSRIASTTSVTLPTGGEWTLVAEQKNNNILATGSAAPSGLMAYCVRGASNPNLTFTHPVAPSVAIGRIVAYRDVNIATPKDTQASFTTAISITAVSGTGLTTTLAGDLIVAMAAGGQEAAWSSFNATSPSGASGATSTAAPTTTWLERADSVTTTGTDTSLGIFDAIKTAAGATGNLTVSASVAAAHVVIAGAFAFNAPATGTGTPAAQAAAASSIGGVSGSDGTGTPAAQAAAASGAGGVSSADAWNAFDKSASVTLANSDKTATLSTDVCAVRSTQTHLNGAVGKYYFELLCSDISGGQAGIADATTEVTSGTSAVYVLGTTGVVYRSGISAGITLGALTNGSVLCVAWDSFAKRIWFRVGNGLWNNNAAALPGTGANGLNVTALAINNHAIWAYSTSGASDPSTVTVRTESAEFTYTVPSGFTPWVVEALAAVEGSGALAAQSAAAGGSGSVGAEAATGTGALAASASAVSGAGVSASVATGAALAAQAATAAGAGISASSGSGALVAQAATASGVGAVASVGSGALAAQAATVAGSGSSVSAGSGALQAAAATVAGAGASISAGTGSIVAGSAELAGTGTAAAGDSGALVAQAATVAGLGVSGSVGTGALQAGAAAITGAGLGDSFGNGALVAGAATITAEGVVLEESAAVGAGALVAGGATLSGEGEVTGEVVQPPVVSLGGGYYRPQWAAVEGIGYGILPQLEGEAHGLVVGVGAGVAKAPRLVGAGTGTVGVAGRGAARLAIIKVAGTGDRGQAGTGAGTITLRGVAAGRYDDDEAAMITLLLAA